MTIFLATYPGIAREADGTLKVRLIEGYKVVFVPYGQQAVHIRYDKFRADYRARNERPFVIVGTKRGFASLDNAVKALIKMHKGAIPELTK